MKKPGARSKLAQLETGLPSSPSRCSGKIGWGLGVGGWGVGGLGAGRAVGSRRVGACGRVGRRSVRGG